MSPILFKTLWLSLLASTAFHAGIRPYAQFRSRKPGKPNPPGTKFLRGAKAGSLTLRGRVSNG